MGGEYRKVVCKCAAIASGRLVELNAMSGGATGSVEIWRNKGRLGVSRAQSTRLSQALYVYPNTDARSRNHCCGDKAIKVKYS